MNDQNRATVPAPNLESHPGHAPLAAQEAARLDTRVSIRVMSYRKYDHDTDAPSAKAVLDGLVRRGILPDDSAHYVKSVTFESYQDSDERTVIEIS